jgi:hypothetical protein
MVRVSDPGEGVNADGTIRTGARRDRVPGGFEAVLDDTVASVDDRRASLYLYGSVAAGTAVPGISDVDLLAIDLAASARLARDLSRRHAGRCRGVEVAALALSDLQGDSDLAYGNRVFLRHYCVHLAGPDRRQGLSPFPADTRAARGFNGDIGHHLERWRRDLGAGTSGADALGVRAARKTLLAVAGLVSIHDGTWTTDRAVAARRWGEVEPDLATGLSLLRSWVDGDRRPAHAEVEAALDDTGVVASVVRQFDGLIGLWAD